MEIYFLPRAKKGKSETDSWSSSCTPYIGLSGTLSIRCFTDRNNNDINIIKNNNKKINDNNNNNNNNNNDNDSNNKNNNDDNN